MHRESGFCFRLGETGEPLEQQHDMRVVDQVKLLCVLQKHKNQVRKQPVRPASLAKIEQTEDSVSEAFKKLPIPEDLLRRKLMNLFVQVRQCQNICAGAGVDHVLDVVRVSVQNLHIHRFWTLCFLLR